MKNLVLIFFVLGLLFTSCLRGDAPDQYNHVRGSVYLNDQPLANADIHIRNHLEPGGYIERIGQSENVELEVEIALANYFTADLYRYLALNPIATFFSDSLMPGSHVIPIPDSLLSNGVFEYIFENSLRSTYTGDLIINKPDSLLPGTIPITKTTDEGEFTINADFLALGLSFSSNELGEFEITDSLEIIVTTKDSVLIKERVRVKPNTDNFFEINID